MPALLTSSLQPGCRSQSKSLLSVSRTMSDTNKQDLVPGGQSEADEEASLDPGSLGTPLVPVEWLAAVAGVAALLAFQVVVKAFEDKGHEEVTWPTTTENKNVQPLEEEEEEEEEEDEEEEEGELKVEHYQELEDDDGGEEEEGDDEEDDGGREENEEGAAAAGVCEFPVVFQSQLSFPSPQ
ncbi:Hypothetical predicted protein [Marmota monax]|uniref:Uncharacterized protein n=1 Tax=Marmota monax TaxID=9995 RepID=A0A5E4C024_MARMO|nr:hypothetical protein GHT09_013092 [Marmota monax]VTJ75258.1 Hypothetical predicted protein [Marmota monax]